jgi:hypothetical protein
VPARKKDLGDCYRWAYHYVLKNPSAILYQGEVKPPLSDDPYFQHAWVVHDGIVKDWQTMLAGFGGKFMGKGYPKAVFEELWQPRKVTTYTRREMLEAAVKSEHYGPW